MDLGSGSGTFINGLKIPALKWCDLKPNSQIGFGALQTKFNFQLCDETLRFSIIIDETQPILIKTEEAKNMEIENIGISMRITRRMKKQLIELQDKCIDLTEENINKYVLLKK